MLDHIRKLLGGAPKAQHTDSWREVQAWADKHAWRYGVVGQGQGWVIEGHFSHGIEFRAEWGPPQRDYLAGQELRVRVVAKAPPDLQMLVMNRHLLQALEKSAFEQFTQANETRIDFDMPEEVRWLSMFPKFTQWEDPSVRAHFVAMAHAPATVGMWLKGDLTRALSNALNEGLKPDMPFVLMTQRGRLYLRTRLDPFDAGPARQFVRLAGTASERLQWLLRHMPPDHSVWAPL